MKIMKLKLNGYRFTEKCLSIGTVPGTVPLGRLRNTSAWDIEKALKSTVVRNA